MDGQKSKGGQIDQDGGEAGAGNTHPVEARNAMGQHDAEPEITQNDEGGDEGDDARPPDRVEHVLADRQASAGAMAQTITSPYAR